MPYANGMIHSILNIRRMAQYVIVELTFIIIDA